MSCVHEQLKASLDRWLEVHWHIHQIEKNYHYPDGVRYSFNSLIRSAKEIPDIISMELQNRADYKNSIKPYIARLKEDPLFSLLSTRRDYLVHRGMLEVNSSGSIGTTEGKKRPKISASFPIQPWESSDEAYQRFLVACKKDKALRSLLGPDCDSWPILRRKWCIPEFPDKDFLEVAIQTWQTLGDTLSSIISQLGGEVLDTTLSCQHDPYYIRNKEYSQEEFFRLVDGINVETGEPIKQ
ncbi:hypothetical protein ACFPK9_11255 [Rubritalea spongiae]|uniref:HEPN AbiU2-like domain-containing protein n=1 Tax=Rubritalea spongiae TaxID=430797 RepID=A0ABW5E048_9BACT